MPPAGLVSAQISSIYVKVTFLTSASTGALTDFLFLPGLCWLMKPRETQHPQDLCPSAKSDCGLATGSKDAGGRVGKERRREDAKIDTPKHKGPAITYIPLTLKEIKVKKINQAEAQIWLKKHPTPTALTTE